ncbi:hypothetical protein Sango_2361400 [Sesamum angolense]|uniref:Uncharacterized protein n=1 Tax=Sesamum angolense TaxID=2727404 RepID=A0AAE1W669_9LAMI|nr:hypothetical protein Sango_2361400 [Sesamum angolense]
MSIFYQEKPQKGCKCLPSSLRDAFSNCHSFPGELPDSTQDQTEEPVSDFDEQDEVNMKASMYRRRPSVFVSAIISKYMESKSKRKSKIAIDSSSNWGLSPPAGVLVINTKAGNNGGEDKEEYFTARSWLPRCSSDTSFDAFNSAITCFSRSSSLDRLDFQDLDSRRRSIIQDLVHCEGWPFGLCRKALLLPPLPKSPADSWSWSKSGKMVKTHG